MKIAITGTPGTGKSSVCKILKRHYPVIDLNKLIEKKKLYTGVDKERGSKIVDIGALIEHVTHLNLKNTIVFDGHIAHYLPVDIVIVLRASPSELRRRLDKQGFSEAKIKENVEAEALDVILVEAVERSDNVYEIDTSGKEVEEVAECVMEIIKDPNKHRDRYKTGSVDWSEEVFG
ncbi:MAG: adenylate kinase family protein [Methanocellales archaeon]|nr:adenylate kinase family protein [Methanocellales archaeon]